MKKCPFCAEEIQDEAIVCRYCGRELDPSKIRKIASSYEGPETAEIIPEGPMSDADRKVLEKWGKFESKQSREPVAASTTDGEATWSYEEIHETKSPTKIHNSAIGPGLAIGFLSAIIAAVFQLVEFSNCNNAYGPYSLACSGFVQDFVSHFLSNFIFWTLIIIALIYAIRKEWKNVGLTLLALIIAILLLTLILGILTGIFDVSNVFPSHLGKSPPATAVSDDRSLTQAARISTPTKKPNMTTPQVATTSRENCKCPWGNFEEVSNLASGTHICVSGRVYTMSQFGYLYWAEHYGTDEWRKAFIRLVNLPLYYAAFHPDMIVDLQGIVGRDEDGNTIISVDIADIRVCK